MLFNNFFFLGGEKTVAVIETLLFQFVSAYFNLFLYCDGKINCTDRW